jgi:hypothetical protein
VKDGQFELHLVLYAPLSDEVLRELLSRLSLSRATDSNEYYLIHQHLIYTTGEGVLAALHAQVNQTQRQQDHILPRLLESPNKGNYSIFTATSR